MYVLYMLIRGNYMCQNIKYTKINKFYSCFKKPNIIRLFRLKIYKQLSKAEDETISMKNSLPIAYMSYIFCNRKFSFKCIFKIIY